MTPGCCADNDCTELTCMKLPDGQTCRDCLHLRRCQGFLGGGIVNNSECDWFPRRFSPKEQESGGGK